LEFEFGAVGLAHSGLGLIALLGKVKPLRPNLILAWLPVQLFGRTSDF
jgi:hypothetical protein